MESSELDSNNQITVKAGEVKSFDVTLRNINNRPVKMNFYYQWISSNPGNVEVGYATTSQDVPPTNTGYILGVNTSKVVTIAIRNNSTSNVTLKFGSEVGLEKANLWFPNNSYSLTQGLEFAPIYKDISGANAPELVEGLIPVVYSLSQNEWVKADTSNGWYAYQDQVWANAVTTTSKNRTIYMNAAPGMVIPMSDINTMWVWIPRYEYKFSNMATGYAGGTALQPGAIGINFIAKNIIKSGNTNNYKVHPAFTFGTDQLAGIWVGKFETGNQTACRVTGNVAGTACDVTTLGVQIKPNVSSWGGIRVSTAFTVGRQMSNSGNAYGLNNTTTDSHMMKNTEWGAVAYLSQSTYGKYANTAYSGANKEVYINNYWKNNVALTGCSAGTPSTGSATTCAYTYEKSNTGTGASTTGNIYGVYDMSGGTQEYVMGNMKANGNLEQQSGGQNADNYNSGFNGINYDKSNVTGGIAYPASKYYDTYNYSGSNSDHSTRYIPGDATYEVSQGDNQSSGWYSDNAIFLRTNGPWFRRGGRAADAAKSGVFYFNNNYGNAITYISFRLVLAPIV